MAGHALHCTKFRDIISNGIKVIRGDKISILKITKGNNSAKKCRWRDCFNLCMSSGHALYLCQVS